jgi:hypothetical protein
MVVLAYTPSPGETQQGVVLSSSSQSFFKACGNSASHFFRQFRALGPEFRTLIFLGVNTATQFLIANPRQVLPLPEVAFETHAFGSLKGGDQATLVLLAAFPDRSQADRYSRRHR